MMKAEDDIVRANDAGLFTNEDAVELYMERIKDPELFVQERKAVERYFTDTDASVLDVGCGVGRVSHLLHERGFDITGIDVSEPLVEKAQSLFPEIDFRVADIRELPFDSGSFDYVIPVDRSIDTHHRYHVTDGIIKRSVDRYSSPASERTCSAERLGESPSNQLSSYLSRL